MLFENALMVEGFAGLSLFAFDVTSTDDLVVIGGGFVASVREQALRRSRLVSVLLCESIWAVSGAGSSASLGAS